MTPSFPPTPSESGSAPFGTGPRIDLRRDTDVAFWCRVFDIEHCELRRAVQQVGPRADAVIGYLRRARAAGGPLQDGADAH